MSIITIMGIHCSSEIKEQPRELTPYERLNKIESIFLREIKTDDPDYRVAQQILNERTLNQYGNMMRNAPNMGF